jgi:putative nucleotidyltransferase with HDIG domain
MSNVEVRKIIGRVSDLPTLPSVVKEVLRIYDDPMSTSKEFADVFSRDQSLSMNILKLVNSSYYSLSKKISSVIHAINLLGYNEVKRLALSISVIKLFPRGVTFSSFSHKDFWIHSLAVAIASELLANKIKIREREDAFICGLVHDIGKLVLEQFGNEKFQEILQLVKVKHIPFRTAEEMKLGFNHSYLGMKLVRKWALPEVFYYGVKFHHDPAAADEFVEFVTTIHTANYIVKKMGLGNSGDRCPPKLHDMAREVFPVTREELSEITQEVLEKTKNARTFLTI